MAKEDRISSALTEHRRRALLPEPSRRRALRRHVGLSQGVIADALGVSAPTASRYEAGISTPKGDVLAKYLQVLALLAVESSDVPEKPTPLGRRRRARWRMKPAVNQSSGATEAGLYLATLFGAADAESLIEVRCPTKPWLRRFFRASAIDAATAHVVACAPATDVYVGVAPRLPAEPQTGGKDVVGHVQTLWADCDTVDSIARLAAFAPAPTQ